MFRPLLPTSWRTSWLLLLGEYGTLISTNSAKGSGIRVSGPRYVPPAFRQQMPNRQPLSTIHSQQAMPSIQETKIKVEPGIEQGVNIDVKTETKPGPSEVAVAHEEAHPNSDDSAGDIE